MICVIFLILFLLKSTAIVIPSVSCDIATNASNIAGHSFDLRKVTVVVWKEPASEVLELILKDYHGVVIALDFNDAVASKMANKCAYQYLFIVRNYEELNGFLTLLNKEQTSQVLVIVVIIENDVSDNRMLVNITKSSYKNDITNIVIICCKDNETIRTMTYFPLQYKNCNNYNLSDVEANGQFEYFPRKFRNFNKCPMTVSVLDYPPFMILMKQGDTIANIEGIEGSLVKLIAEILNATLNFSVPAEGSFGTLSNGHWTGSVGDIVNGVADISATSALVNYGRYRATQVTYCYKFQKMVLCAPQRREIRAWAKAFLPLFTDSTILLAVSSFLLFLVSNIARRVEVELKDRPENSTLFWSWALFLGQQVVFETKSWIMNGMFALWLGFCLILRIAYQGELAICLQQQILEPPYETLTEAINNVDAYGGLQSLLTFFTDNDHQFADNYNNLSVVQVSAWLDRISKGERLSVTIEISSLYDLGYAHQLQIVEEAVVHAPVAVLVRKRWAAADEISTIVTRIVEAGLYDEILGTKQKKYRLMVAKEKRALSRFQFTYNALGWASLGACFYGLVIEWFVCILVLWGEILWHRLKSKAGK